jgi:hypothetical protein
MDTNESREDGSSGREVGVGALECVESVEAELMALNRTMVHDLDPTGTSGEILF